MHRIYLLTKAKQLLMTDARVAASDLELHVTEDGRVVVTGEVTSDAQHDAVDEVLGELPEHPEVLNRTHLRGLHPPGAAEPIVTEEHP